MFLIFTQLLTRHTVAIAFELGLSPIGNWIITPGRSVNNFSSRQGNEKNCWGFKNLLWEEVGRGGNGDLGNDKTLKSF